MILGLLFFCIFCLWLASVLLLIVCWKQNQILKSHNRMILELGTSIKEIIKWARAEMAENYEPKKRG